MLDGMKYIVAQNDEGKEEIFIFSKTIDHDCMAEAFFRIKNQSWGDWLRVRRFPVSAGFIQNGECVGKSETLKMSSRPEDSDFL